jgi:peptide-methionine (S)-S-oxide reductase
MYNSLETATVAGGCFWCTEAIFKQLRGVDQVISGYAGGIIPNPSYEDIVSGTTGHAEAIQITFDPNLISYADLLRVFWHTHDPTTTNQQGYDVGPQYRSVVFYHNKQQQQTAEQVKQEVIEEKVYSDPIVTEIIPLEQFYPAEAYHQDFYEKNPNKPYCLVVINPKLASLRKKFLDKLKQ